MSEHNMSEWIDVNERLPELNQDVLVCKFGNSVMCYSHRITENGVWYGYGQSFGTKSVTHWMPLPPPPTKL